MAYIEGYPICTTPSKVLTVGIRRPESFENGLLTIVRGGDRIWLLIADEGYEESWVEIAKSGYSYTEYSFYYDDFEREHLEALMVESGEIVMSLADGAL